MGLSIATPATVSPVTVEEVRGFARYPFDDADELFQELIGAATDHVQQAASRQFVQAEFALTLRAFPGDDIIRLPRSPVLSVESVSYRDRDGNVVSLAEDTDFLIDTASEPSTIEPVRSWPVTGNFPDAVQINFIAGYPGDGGSPEDLTANVPSRAKVAIKALTAWWFEQREPAAFASVSEAPYHVRRLINGLKVWR